MLLLIGPAQAQASAPSSRPTSREAAKSAAHPRKSLPPRAGDVMATVDGSPITRRQLTSVWLQTDPGLVSRLGALLVRQWEANAGAAAAYTVSAQQIYDALYPAGGGASAAYSPVLANLVTNRLLEILASRDKIQVSDAECSAAAHAMFDKLRAQKGLRLTDAEIIRQFHIPRPLLMSDMAFRLRTEKLLAHRIARRIGHPVGADDWIVARELFASDASGDGTAAERSAAARKRLEERIARVNAGASMEEVAAENENGTASSGGLLGPSLRGTGSPSIEAVVFALKPGTLSPPLRGPGGWYAFRVEKRGDQIPAERRRAAWDRLVQARRQPFLLSLWKAARITSVVSLPTAPSPPASGAQPPGSQQAPAEGL